MNSIEFKLELLDEESPVKGNVSGDYLKEFITSDTTEEERAKLEKTAKDLEESIALRIEKGDKYAWCTIKVTATYERFEEVMLLKMCSFDEGSNLTEVSKELKEDGIFDELKDSLIELIKESAILSAKALKNLGVQFDPTEHEHELIIPKNGNRYGLN